MLSVSGYALDIYGNTTNSFSLYWGQTLSTNITVRNFSTDDIVNNVYISFNGTNYTSSLLESSTASDGWDVSTATYDSVDFDLNIVSTGETGLYFSSDGTKFYIINNNDYYIYQYNLSTAWDLSTASYIIGTRYPLGSQTSTPAELSFDPTGTKLYVSSWLNSAVYQYSLSSAWNITTATYDSKVKSTASEDATIIGVTLSSDGTKMYVTGLNTKTAYQYTLGTAWDVSTATYSGKSYNMTEETPTNYPRTLFFTSDGLKLYSMNYTHILQYDVGVAWDVSTATYSNIYDFSSEDGLGTGIFFKDDGTKLYLNGDQHMYIYQYSLSDASTTSIYGIDLLLDIISVGSRTIDQYVEQTSNTTNSSTAFTILVNNYNNNTVTLSASPSWTVNVGTTSTITCSSLVGSTTLYRDGIAVTNPYVAIESGTHIFQCNATATGYEDSTTSNTLTVGSTGSGCTSTDDFIYTGSTNGYYEEAVFNMTYYVNSYIVRDDLNDVVSDVGTITKNITGDNYYIIVTNTTAVNPTLSFGNYYSDFSVSEAPYTNASLTSLTVTQDASYYYTFDTLDEMNTTRQQPPNSTDTLTIFCSNGASIIPIEDTQYSIPTNSQVSQVQYGVSYSATETYYRDLLVENTYEYKTFYMADALIYSINQYTIKLQDNTVSFGNATLHIKKLINSNWITITELPFDAEGKAIVYLINNQQYQITVKSDDGTQERVVGNLYADSVNLEKTIVINEVTSVDLSDSKVGYDFSYDNTTGVIQFTWSDENGNTNLTEMYVYDYSDPTTLLFYGSSTNTSSVVLTYTVPDKTHQYIVNVKVHHYVFGLNTIDRTWIVGMITSFIKELIPEQTTLTLLCTFALIILIMSFSMAHASTGGIIVSVFAVFLSYVELLPPAMFTISIVALFLAILNKATER